METVKTNLFDYEATPSLQPEALLPFPPCLWLGRPSRLYEQRLGYDAEMITLLRYDRRPPTIPIASWRTDVGMVFFCILMCMPIVACIASL
jgi:hypothetical protein